MFLYVANWKMNMPFYRAGEFCKENYDGFEVLSKLPGKKIVLCPSYTEIIAVLAMFEGLELAVGAQSCSSRKIGSYTGQVSALSLADIGCTYCIVGHSEAREYLSEKNEEVADKVLRLLECNIVPILCVGEKIVSEDVETAILGQLEPVFAHIRDFGVVDLCVAYEPIWAIGTGVTPDVEYVEKFFNSILKVAKHGCPEIKIKLLYGGSVDENSAKKMKSIKNIGGFLIGGASLDFKKFEKIVQL